jgi:hypothetical protein
VQLGLRTIIISGIGAIALALPAVASADSGTIGGIGMLGEDHVQASFTVTGDLCSASGYCGFFGFARSVGPNDACGATAGRPVWVQNGVSSTSGTVTETENWLISDRNPFKLCLYTYHPVGQNFLLAEAAYDPPEKPAPAPVIPASAPPPAPAPTPTPTAPAPTAPVTNTGATQRCDYWSGQETKRGKTYKAAKKAYLKRRTSARKRAMKVALAKLRTAESKALSACG